jgi:D-hexose-6-phosphate mutarotase
MKSLDEKVLEAAEDLDSLIIMHQYLRHPPKVGDVDWGGYTQAERDAWRRKAEDYAQNWELEFTDSADNQIIDLYEDIINISDNDLARGIEFQTEDREESVLYQTAKELGFGEDIKAAYSAMEEALLNAHNTYIGDFRRV